MDQPIDVWNHPINAINIPVQLFDRHTISKLRSLPSNFEAHSLYYYLKTIFVHYRDFHYLLMYTTSIRLHEYTTATTPTTK